MANSTLGIHVAVIDWSDEAHLRCFEGIVSWELGVEQEQSILIRSLFGSK